jgi:tricorn protease
VFPRFSPDGNSIAFSSNRDGNYDVFVIPVTGGKPKQLTFHTADDNVVGWTPDGKKVIFSPPSTSWETPIARATTSGPSMER